MLDGEIIDLDINEVHSEAGGRRRRVRGMKVGQKRRKAGRRAMQKARRKKMLAKRKSGNGNVRNAKEYFGTK